MRITTFLAALLLPGMALAQNGGLTATGSSASIGAEVTALDTSFNAGHATMAGANAHFQLGSFLRAEGRYLTGTMTSTYPISNAHERAHLIEGEADIGFAATSSTRLFIGGGYRLLNYDPYPGSGGDRTSHTIYLPAGLASHARVSSNWTAVTTLAAGLMLYGREEIDNPIVGVDETFDRESGWIARASIEFGRDYGLGVLSIEPFFRYYNLDRSNTENGTFVVDTEATEGGVRFNYQL